MSLNTLNSIVLLTQTVVIKSPCPAQDIVNKTKGKSNIWYILKLKCADTCYKQE